MDAEIQVCRQQLANWTEAFEAQHGRPPKIPDIEANEVARSMYERARALERASAPPPEKDGCQYYIARRRRYCTRRQADGHGEYCTEHARVTNRTSNISTGNTCISISNSCITGNRNAPTQQQQCVSELVDDSTNESQKETGFKHKKTNINRRMKRMTNPFAQQHAVSDISALADEVSNAFRDKSLPMFVDIGCARGAFLQKLAVLQSTGSNPALSEKYNFLGIEIYAPLVERANAWRTENDGTKGILHYVAGTAQSILPIFQDNTSSSNALPKVGKVCIQFPDPWSKKHKRRRLVDEDFANLIADILMRGGEVYFASDYEEIAEDILQSFTSTGKFTVSHDSGSSLLRENDENVTVEWLTGGNPYGAGTERDEVCELHWRQSWRQRLIRS